jgi:predicted membrane protein
VNPDAPPASAEAHTDRSGARTASLLAVRGGIVAFVVTALAAQIVPVGIAVFGGGLALSTAVRLGWFYELAFHRVAIDVTGSGGVTGRLAVAFLSGTGLAMWALFRAGRTAARHAGPSTRDRVLAGAMVGPVYALPIAVITSLVRLRLHTGGVFVPETIGFHGVVWQAFVLPALLGTAAGASAGALCSLPRGSHGRGWLVGGWRGLLGALGLAAIGVLVLAAVRPQGAATYARVVSSNGTRVAVVLLGHHALLVPNQSFFVLGPSMGGCTDLRGLDTTIPLLCPGRLPILESTAILDDLARVVGGSGLSTAGPIPDRPVPAGYWAFVLVPALATLAAGRSAAAGVGGRIRLREALVRGAGAGVMFSVLVGVGVWMANASLFVRAGDGSGTTSLTLGPPPVPATLLALAWGVVGGALGAVTRRQDEGTPVPVEPDAPVPPSPTSV